MSDEQARIIGTSRDRAQDLLRDLEDQKHKARAPSSFNKISRLRRHPRRGERVLQAAEAEAEGAA